MPATMPPPVGNIKRDQVTLGPENRYCASCGQTTRHEKEGDSFTCRRCGRRGRRQMGSLYRGPKAALEMKLDKVLGLKEETEKPQPVKPEGEQKKTKGAAHRFDDGVKFTQMRADDQFKTKADPKTLR